MDHRPSRLSRWVIGLVCAGGALGASAQTRPGEIANPGTYKGSMELQRQYDQQQQQFRTQQQQQSDQQWQGTLQQQQARQNADIAQGQAVLRSWQARPPLDPAHNPLLGRWNSQGSTMAGNQRLAGGGDLGRMLGPEMAQMTSALLGGITGGMCDSMLGRGLIEFRPNALVAIGADGRERVKYRVQYRGGGARVVVLPQDAVSFTHMIIDFDGRDHATVAAVGCGIARAGGAAAAASPGATTTTTALAAPAGRAATGGSAAALVSPAATPANHDTSAAVLTLTANASEKPGQFSPSPGHDVWLLKGSADMALIRGGLQSTPNGSLLHNFMLACQRHLPECQKGMKAIQSSSVSLVRTDSSGRARTPDLPAGRYYVFAPFVFNQRPMVWHLPIDLHGGSNTLALDLANARPVD